MYNKDQKYYHNSKVIIYKNDKETIDYTCDFKLTPLFLSLNNNDEEESIKLINNGCRINYDDNFENTPIGLALLLRLFKVVNLLLLKDVYINYNDTTILNNFFNVSRYIDFNIFIDNLFKHNIPLNKDIINICINSASLINFNQFLDKLYDYKPIIKNDFIKLFITDKNYNVLLSLFNYNNNGNKFKLEYDDTILKYMLNYKKKINDVFEILVKTGFKPKIEKYDTYKNSLLYNVINCSHNDNLLNIIKYLLDNNVFINYDLIEDNFMKGYSKSFIYQKLMKKCYNKFYNVYNLEETIQKPKYDFIIVGHDPLIDAIHHKNKKITKLLLDNNIKLNNCYYSAVFYAIEFSYEDILDELIKKGANISSDLENVQYSYIYQALNNYQYTYALKLLQNGAKYNYKFDNFKYSLLYYALQKCKSYYFCGGDEKCGVICHNCDTLGQKDDQQNIISFLLNNDTRYTLEMIKDFYKNNGKDYMLDIENLI